MYISFRILGKDTIKQASKKLLNDLKYKTSDCLGYIQNSKGIFLFYEISYKKYKVNFVKKIHNYGGLLFMKFVTLKRILNFPIHNSVTYLFFNNNKLIYLKNKDDVNIQIPTIGYYTESKELLFISVMGIKSSSSKTFGAYYYFQNYQNLFRGSLVQ